MANEKEKTLTDIEILGSLRLPSNSVTDGFGYRRDWAPRVELDIESGRAGWYPGCGYRPLHYGVDFSARPDDEIRAPADGTFRYDRANQTIAFISDFSKADPRIVIYYRHITRESSRFSPLGFGQWTTCLDRELLATHDRKSPYAAHLHLELAVADDVRQNLIAQHILSGIVVTPDMLKARAKAHNLSEEAVIAAVVEQMKTDGITGFMTHSIRRAWLPEYKQLPNSTFGKGMTWLIDPLEVMRHEA